MILKKKHPNSLKSIFRYLLQYFLPFIIISIIVNLFSLVNIYQRELEKMNYDLNTSANKFANYIDQIERFAFDISINDNIQNLLLEGKNSFLTSYAQSNAFDNFIGLNRYNDLSITHLKIMLPSRHNILYVGNHATRAYEFDTTFSENPDYSVWILSGETTYYGRTSNSYNIISYYQKIYDLSSNRYIGLIRIDIDETALKNHYISSSYDTVQELYIQQEDDYISLSATPNQQEYYLSKHTKKITTQIGEFFLLSSKFDVSKLLFENSLIIPLILFTVLFIVLFLFVAYRFLHLVIAPIYSLNETIHRMSFDEPIAKLNPETNNIEIKLIYESVNQLVDTLNEYIETNKEILYQEQLAKTLYFQSQINPHFLYNTLDTIRFIALKNKDKEVANELYHLSCIYRYYLNHGDAFVPIREELELIDLYMEIQKKRFLNRFIYKQEISPEIHNIFLPKLLLQPLIENAVQHGFTDQEENCRITLSIKHKQDKLLIRIADNGCGIEKDMINKIKNNELFQQNSFAIANIKKRLELYYGNNASISFKSKKGYGTLVTITISHVGDESKI